MEEQWISLDTKVTIVNRKKSYQIPKQKLSSIPYFVKLFSDSNCDTTKIEVDLDEDSFDNIISFILDDHLCFSMESALFMMETADYLGMDEIKQKNYDLYKSNFIIEYLEEFLDFYEKRKSPEVFTQEKLNSFVAKFFLPITQTRTFLKFPVNLLERILKLDLVVSYEYQIVEAIDRWTTFDVKDRNQYLPRLIKFVNFCHLHKQQMKNVANILENAGFCITSLQLNAHSLHPCYPEICQLGCESTRHYYKSLIAIYELDEDTIEIQRLSKLKLWVKYDQFDRDETISTSLIEAHHIFDIIYDTGRKGIRVDWNTKKFKYLKMFGEDNSYYGQVNKYITHDIPVDNSYGLISNSEMSSRYGPKIVDLACLESISLENNLEGVCYGKDIMSVFSDNGSDEISKYIHPIETDYITYCHLPSLDYRKLSPLSFTEPTVTRSRLAFDKDQKVMYFLTNRFFSLHFLREFRAKKLDHSFLESFIGSDSLDHIELISHNNSVLICNKLTKTIYSYVKDTDYWQFISKARCSGKMITIVSINLPIDLE